MEWNANRRLWIAISVILTLFCADAVNSILWNIKGEPPKFSIYFRILLEILIIGLLFSNKIKITFCKPFLIAFAVYGLTMFADLIYAINCPYANILHSFYSKNKNFYVFFMFYFLGTSFYATPPQKRKYFFKAYEFVILTAFTSIVLGFLFNIQIFSTYSGERFGYSGIIPRANESSVFWLIALFYSMAVLVREKRKFLLVCCCIACVLVGTKALLLLLIMVLPIFVWKFYPKYGKLFCLFSLMIAVVLFKIYITPVLDILGEKEGMQKIIQPIEILMNSDNYSYAMSSVSSGRFSMEGEVRVYDRIDLNLAYWQPINYLLGGMFIGTEMEIFDIPMKFGFVGVILLIYGYYLVVERIHNSFRRFFITFILILAIFSGHVFDNALCTTYLCLFVLYFQYVPQNKLHGVIVK